MTSAPETPGDPLVTFVIPSIGRSSLPTTLRSLIDQRSPNWKAIVVFDAVPSSRATTLLSSFSDDRRIHTISLPEKTGGKRNWGGDVRNAGMRLVDTEWTGFLDDDDTVCELYLDMFREELRATPDLDVALFRIKYHDTVIPHFNNPSFSPGNIGIAAIARTAIHRSEKHYFFESRDEDLDLFSHLRDLGKKLVVSPYLGYYVRSSTESLRHRINCTSPTPLETTTPCDLAASLVGTTWSWWEEETITFRSDGTALWSHSTSAAFSWLVADSESRRIEGTTASGVPFTIVFDGTLLTADISEGQLAPRRSTCISPGKTQ